MRKPICKVVNNNQPGWTAIVETKANVTLDVGSPLYDQYAVDLLNIDIKTLEAQLTTLKDNIEGAASNAGLPFPELAGPDDFASEINGLREELKRLREGLQKYLDGDYPSSRTFRPNRCPHGQEYWQGCGECDDDYLADLLEQKQ